MTLILDDRFIDIDFENDPNFTRGDKGLSPFCGMDVFEDMNEVLTDAQIDAEIEAIDAAGGGAERLVTRILNQGREGSCVANAFTQAHQILQALQVGRENVIQLSPISLYDRIGSSPSSGAMVSDGLDEMTSRGICPLDTPENRARFPGMVLMPATGFHRESQMPAGWQNSAKLFAGVEYQIARSVNGIFTALCKQWPVVVGREGHCIPYCRPTRSGGGRKAIYANSWDDTWGMAMGHMSGGFGADTINQIKKSAAYAVVIRTVIYPVFTK